MPAPRGRRCVQDHDPLEGPERERPSRSRRRRCRPLLDKVDATLEYRLPAQRDRLVGDLSAGERAVAVYNVKTLLERIATMEKSTAPDDQAAVARLTKVRLDPTERERLAADAEHFESDSAAVVDSDDTRWARLEGDFFALWAWLDEWSRAAQRATTGRSTPDQNSMSLRPGCRSSSAFSAFSAVAL